MGLEDADLLDDGDAAGGGRGGGGKAASSIPCSICLEDVTDYADRAWAKLQCGHQFHLDCIGSAFNVKGVMQCPNCRKIEKGQWLYADGCRPYPELNIDDLVNDEDLYDLSYSDSSMWCPFGGFTRLAAAFDEVEFPTTAYHDLVGQHAVFSEHATVSSATHICPYIAYVQPLPSSTSSANVADGLRYNSQWNSQSAPSEVPNSYAFPTMDVHYHSLFQTPSSRIGDVDHPSRRPARTNADITRSGSYVHPFLVGQSSASRAPGSVGSSMIHPYPGSAARARERSQALQAYFQQPSNVTAIRTPGSQRSNGQVLSSSSDQSRGGIYYLPASGSSNTRNFQEAENSMLNPYHHIYPVERGPFQQGGGGPGASFRQRHGSERTPSQSQYWS
ncbi:E3 ubiquitin-protein ligase RFI2-like [Cynara cardunculus var. scolymus]|uniref:E3 ubiquitin-protein ligase RFI2-like n=1 Tax=Cynara cardunculus var. scolymus TaxID=59895 RepID=UPI000D62849D|nr:E3 ubiquitin-protein ligase RFI2-like [Cynara cardunculus var. scolymus]